MEIIIPDRIIKGTLSVKKIRKINIKNVQLN